MAGRLPGQGGAGSPVIAHAGGGLGGGGSTNPVTPTEGLVSGKVSAEVVAALAAQAGLRGQALQTAVAVSFAENGSHDSYATHRNSDGSVDTGLWQINSVHGQWTEQQLKNAGTNAAAMYVVSSHGTDWTPWTTYTSRAYVAKLPAAAAAIRSMQADGGPSRVLVAHPPPGSTSGDGGLPGSGLVGDALGVITTPISWGESLAKFLGALMDRSTWIRVAEILGGLALGIGALYMLARQAGIAPKGVPIPV